MQPRKVLSRPRILGRFRKPCTDPLEHRFHDWLSLMLPGCSPGYYFCVLMLCYNSFQTVELHTFWWLLELIELAARLSMIAVAFDHTTFACTEQSTGTHVGASDLSNLLAGFCFRFLSPLWWFWCVFTCYVYVSPKILACISSTTSSSFIALQNNTNLM